MADQEVLSDAAHRSINNEYLIFFFFWNNRAERALLQ